MNSTGARMPWPPTPLSASSIGYTFAATDPDAIAAAITDRTQVIVIESPTNPLLTVIDIAKVAELARARGITTIIDNTFASPINQKPIELGIDIVVHSGTKYLGGHSDLCCGVAVTSHPSRKDPPYGPPPGGQSECHRPATCWSAVSRRWPCASGSRPPTPAVWRNS